MLGFQPLSSTPLSSLTSLLISSPQSKRRFINIEGVTDTNLIFVNKTGNLLLTAPTENYVTITTTTNRVS